MSKDQLIKRHSEYVLLYNANQDASGKHRKTDLELVKDLKRWERLQAEHVAKGATESFNPKEHYQKYRDEFKQLEDEIKKRLERAKRKNEERSIQTTTATQDFRLSPVESPSTAQHRQVQVV